MCQLAGLNQSSLSAFTGKMHVSLAEALEVRGGPLQEEEVWAVLSQSAESLQELFHKGMDMCNQDVSLQGGILARRKRNTFSDIHVLPVLSTFLNLPTLPCLEKDEGKDPDPMSCRWYSVFTNVFITQPIHHINTKKIYRIIFFF